MAISNIDLVGQGLAILGRELEPFIERVIAPQIRPGAVWTVLLRAKDAGKSGRTPDRDYETSDYQCQLRAITESLPEIGFAFNDALSRAEQNLAGELREVRNKWAHRTPFSADDALRALDTIERLLKAIGQPAASAEVRVIRLDAQRKAFAEETRRDTHASTSAMPDLGAEDLPAWREVQPPLPDVASGQFARAEFAADLYRVARGEGESEYVDPVQFFQRTYLTEGLRTLLTMSTRRIGGDPNAQAIINLQTAFGGGKTHSMLAAWHLFGGTPLDAFPQDVHDALDGEHSSAVGAGVRRVAIVGNEISPGQPSVKDDGTVVNTLWGELAWQLGGASALHYVAEADATGTNPGAALRDLLAAHSPALILIDEWVAYARGLYGREGLPGGTFETQFTFAQQLTQAVQSTPGVLLLVSIPASDVRLGDDDAPLEANELEVGGANGRAALERLQHVVRRVAHNWTPASSGESFEIVRRRLFQPATADGLRAKSVVVRRFAEFYRSQAGELPMETRQVEYEARLRDAYPIHPELFDRLYSDWSTLERFQRTRGVLRMMSAIVHALWESGDQSPLIMPGSLPLDHPAVRDEVTSYLDEVWRSIIETDVDGATAASVTVDKSRPLFGDRALTRRIARTVLLGSATAHEAAHRGLDRQRVFLGVATPGDTLGNFGSSLQMLSDRAMYLYGEGTRYWFDRQPSLNRMAADRAAAVAVEDVFARAVDLLKGEVGTSRQFASVIVAPAASIDVADADSLRLVVLHPRHTLTGRDDSSSDGRAMIDDLVRRRGTAARMNVNTLVVLAPDSGRWADVEDALRQHVAWGQIVDQTRELDLTVSQAEQAKRRLAETRALVKQRLAAAWTWLAVPVQRDGSQPVSISLRRLTSDDQSLAVRAAKRLDADGDAYTTISPIALALSFEQYLRSRWNAGHLSVGELWEYHLRYPYMARLRDKHVLIEAIRSIMDDPGWTGQGFALATGYDDTTGDYAGLTVPLEDDLSFVIEDSTLLVQPRLATAQRERERREALDREQLQKPTPGEEGGGPTEGGTARASDPNPLQPRSVIRNVRFDSAIDFDGEGDLRARLLELVDDVLVHLQAADPDLMEVRLSVSAEKLEGFGEGTARVVSENARSLRMSHPDFEDR